VEEEEGSPAGGMEEEGSPPGGVEEESSPTSGVEEERTKVAGRKKTKGDRNCRSSLAKPGSAGTPELGVSSKPPN
jgi:hypothetical protein